MIHQLTLQIYVQKKSHCLFPSANPIIYNIARPGPTKLIETLDLPAGEKKCTEHAHNGADAYFDYTVTYPDGEIKEERFSSHYVAWPKLCLVGKKPDKEDAEDTSEDEKNNTEEEQGETQETEN